MSEPKKYPPPATYPAGLPQEGAMSRAQQDQFFADRKARYAGAIGSQSQRNAYETRQMRQAAATPAPTPRFGDGQNPAQRMLQLTPPPPAPPRFGDGQNPARMMTRPTGAPRFGDGQSPAQMMPRPTQADIVRDAKASGLATAKKVDEVNALRAPGMVVAKKIDADRVYAGPTDNVKDSGVRSRNSQGGTDTVYTNRLTDPSAIKEFGRAIYSDSYRGATQRGAREDFAAAKKQKNTPYGFAGGKPDFYNGVDIRGMEPAAQRQFIAADRAHSARMQGYLRAMNKFNSMSKAQRRGLTPPQAPELPNSVADGRNVARAGETTPRSEQMADEQRKYQQAMDLARLDPASRERIAGIQAGSAREIGAMNLLAETQQARMADKTENRKTDALMSEAAAARQDVRSQTPLFVHPQPIEPPENASDDVIKQIQLQNAQRESAANDAQEELDFWLDDQQSWGKTPDITEFYRQYPIYRMYAPPSIQNLLYGPKKSYAEGGPVDAAPSDPSQALVGAYQDYAARAQEMNLPVVPFEVFSEMQGGAMQSVQGYAGGGSVAGKMVIDTDPNAPTDSIPAVIDGTQPAKLDSGEFIFPKDVSAFFGTQRLNKMIEQARSGQKPKGAMAEARQ